MTPNEKPTSSRLKQPLVGVKFASCSLVTHEQKAPTHEKINFFRKIGKSPKKEEIIIILFSKTKKNLQKQMGTS